MNNQLLKNKLIYLLILAQLSLSCHSLFFIFSENKVEISEFQSPEDSESEEKEKEKKIEEIYRYHFSKKNINGYYSSTLMMSSYHKEHYNLFFPEISTPPPEA